MSKNQKIFNLLKTKLFSKNKKAKSILVISLIFLIIFISGMLFIYAEITSEDIQLTSPINELVTNDNTTNFVFNVTSSSNTTGIDCSVYLDNTFYGSNESVFNVTSTTITSAEIPSGVYSWYINCTDVDETNQSSSRTIIIDVTNPIATLGTNPVETYNSTSTTIVFDAKCSDNVGLTSLGIWANDTGVWKSIVNQSSPTNDTWYNLSVSGMTESGFRWGARCNDSSGAFGWSTNRTIMLDTTSPAITLPDYANMTQYRNNQNMTFNISAIDIISGISNCVINVATATASNVTVVYSDGWCNGTYALTGATDGNNTIMVYANNSVNLFAVNNSYVVWIDTTPPTIIHNSPSNSSYYNYAPSFNGTCTDSGSGISTIWTNATEYNTADTTSPYNFTNTSALTDGAYLVKLYCNDTLNNTATELFNFTYDATPPELVLVSPEDNHNFASGTTSIDFSWNVTDNLASNISCNVYTQEEYQETTYCEKDTTCNQTISGFLAGSYTWTVNCSDGINQNISETRNFVILHSGGGGGGGGSSSGNQTNTTNETKPSGYNYTIGYLDGKSRSARVGLNEVLNFGANGEEHMLKVISLTNKSVTLRIWSGVIQIILDIGETRKIDLNGNEYADLEITFMNISGGKANLVLKELIESGLCGDGTCSIIEEESGCCNDCGCELGYECRNGKCEIIVIKSDELSLDSWMLIGMVIVVLLFLIYIISTNINPKNKRNKKIRLK